MYWIKKTVALSFVCIAVCQAQVWVELVPSPPPPHQPGQNVTLDVYAHSEIAFDRYVKIVQLDFSDTTSPLEIGPNFVFDLSSSTHPQDFTTSPALPVPLTQNLFEYGCDWCFLFLPALGVLHIGNVSVQLPASIGIYRVDVLNADDPDVSKGARIKALSLPSWRAYTGEITGGRYDFFVGLARNVPTISGWGTILLISLLTGIGSLMVWKRRGPTLLPFPTVC